MSLNSSRFPESMCSFPYFSKASEPSSVYYQVTFTTCVISSLLAPMAVVGNALIMAAIWRNPSLRTPSYVLLAGLAFTDFCTGLLSQPFFVMYQLAGLTGNIKIFCIGRLITGGFAYFFSSLAGIVMTLIAIERWLHMSRRSLLTVRRIVILYFAIPVFLVLVVAARINIYGKDLFNIVIPLFLLVAAFCVAVTAFSYFKVFRIIRHHQCQVQINDNSINMEKYRKSISTMFYLLAVFVLSYIPYLCCMIVVFVLQDKQESSYAAFNACAAIVFSSSLVNLLLYYWRIKEIRDSIRPMVKKLCCNRDRRARES